MKRTVLRTGSARGSKLLSYPAVWSGTPLESGELWQEIMHTRALDLSIWTDQNQFFSASQNEQVESDLSDSFARVYSCFKTRWHLPSSKYIVGILHFKLGTIHCDLYTKWRKPAKPKTQQLINQGPVVQSVDNFIQRINPYPADKISTFLMLIGQRANLIHWIGIYPLFVQSGPDRYQLSN